MTLYAAWKLIRPMPPIPAKLMAQLSIFASVEIDFYFDDTAQWLNYQKGAQEPDIPLHLIGTYNSAASPNLGEIVLRYAAVVYFDSILVSEDETIQGGKRI